MTQPGVPASVSIVIPAFNEEANIAKVLRASVETLERLNTDYEVIVVDDASDDRTVAIVKEYAATNNHIRLIEPGANIGANAAALLGMREARCELIFFIPADLQIMPDQLERCLPLLARADYVCTVRNHRADPWYRRVMAAAYNAAVRLAFRVRTHDVDSSVLIRRSVIVAIAPELTSSSDFLPVEMLVRARSHGFRIAQVGIEHHPRIAGVPTAIRPREVVRTLVDMIGSIVRLRRVLRSGRPPGRRGGR